MPYGGADPLLDDGKFIGCPTLFSIQHTKKGQTSPLPANFTIQMGDGILKGTAWHQHYCPCLIAENTQKQNYVFAGI